MFAKAKAAETRSAGKAHAVGDGVWRVTAGEFPSNAYICATAPGEAFLIDPGLDPLATDAALKTLGLTPRQVFCTHGHFDHVGGAAHFQQAYGAEVFLHPADLKTMKTSNFLLMVIKLEQRITLPSVTFIEPDTAIPVGGGGSVTYRPVPGHTPGSCFIAYGDQLFTGDSLYARGVGLSNLPGENHDLLRQSLLALWDEIPSGCTVHPGHGRSAPFAEIRETNRPLRAFLGLEAGEPA
jgi:hydroxyacylglutathione hydrolase